MGEPASLAGAANDEGPAVLNSDDGSALFAVWALGGAAVGELGDPIGALAAEETASLKLP